MTAPLSKDAFEALVARLFVGELSDAEQQALEAAIAADPAALARYVETVHLREGLPYLLGGESPGGPSRGGQGLQQGDAPERVLPHPGPLSEGEGVRSTRHKPSWATAAAIAFIAGAALAAVASRKLAPDTTPADRGDALAVRGVTSTPTAPFVQENWLGKITGLSLEASTDGVLEAMQVGQQLRCGEVVQLSQGFMRVVLYSGPEFLVEGPAEFSLVSEEGLFLRTGRMAARGQRRFIVQTPLVTAECQSADASFEAADDDSANVYVEAGVATLFTTAQEHVSSEKLQVLHEQEGLFVQGAPDRGGRLTMAARGPMDHVVRQWSQIEARLSDYQQLVLGDRPTAYWPLERVRKNRRVLDLTQHGHDGWPIGNWPAEPAGDGESGTYFNGECYIEPDRKPPIDPRTGFSVEGWAKVVGGPEFQSIFTSRWVLKSHEPDCQMFGFTLYAGETDSWEFWTGSGRKGQLWQRLVSDVPVDRTQWAYVAATFVADGPQTVDDVEGTVRLYVNGRLVASDTHQESLTDFEWPARIGAAEFVPRYLTSWLFQGHLRDVAVYDYPLEASRIEAHFDAGQDAVSGATSRLHVGDGSLIASATGERGL